MTKRGDDSRPSEGQAEAKNGEDDESDEDGKLGWYVDKLLDLLSLV